nr:hypothetical protein Ade03nite_00050 [Actinoplanes derwentensis]
MLPSETKSLPLAAAIAVGAVSVVTAVGTAEVPAEVPAEAGVDIRLAAMTPINAAAVYLMARS